MANHAATNGETASTRKPVSVSLAELQAGSVPFSQLEEAFGPSSLGIILVSDLPASFPELRRKVLSYSSYLAALPSQELAKLENSAAKYLVGWSLGKEKLKSNKPDTLKGSYYVNCAFYKDPQLQSAPLEAPCGDDGDSNGGTTRERYDDFPEYTAPNVWPAEDVLPGFREACEELCSLIIDVAVLVAGACDRFAQAHVDGYEPGYLQRIVTTSLTTKARLLHYFPPPSPPKQSEDEAAVKPNAAGEEEEEDDWCATHLDHGCLTGLTSAMYIDESLHSPILPSGSSSSNAPPLDLLLPELDAAPDAKAGLYIHARDAQVTKVSIPRDCLAFQTGEALELITRGKFRAVPHFVRGCSSSSSSSSASGAAAAAALARNTLAVFTQPNLWEPVTLNHTAAAKQTAALAEGQHNDNDNQKNENTFAAFARGVVARNY